LVLVIVGISGMLRVECEIHYKTAIIKFHSPNCIQFFFKKTF
jgi:hypothetical protein